ncbi:MAG: hypothetical protein FWE61_02875 [Micrococcales bacterium]|nr:hypothetical protein [Micrococcales bacterium]
MTTVSIPDDLAVQVASVTGADLSTFVEAAVRQAVVSKRARRMEHPSPITPVGGAGVLPDIDLSRWAQAQPRAAR